MSASTTVSQPQIRLVLANNGLSALGDLNKQLTSLKLDGIAGIKDNKLDTAGAPQVPGGWQIPADTPAREAEPKWPDFPDNAIINEVSKAVLGVYWPEFYKENEANFVLVSDTISYPLRKDIYNAYKIKPQDIKCIILGQDPYPGLNSDGKPAAQGYSFSTARNVKLQPSLALIYEELLDSKMITKMPSHGDIASSWTPQGVMLFNAALTVRPGTPETHLGPWTAILLKTLNYIAEVRARINKKCVIMLWGAKARKIITHRQFPDSMVVLQAGHPSPLNRNCRQRGNPNGFIGCGHFAKCNELLISQGEPPINWTVNA